MPSAAPVDLALSEKTGLSRSRFTLTVPCPAFIASSLIAGRHRHFRVVGSFVHFSALRLLRATTMPPLVFISTHYFRFFQSISPTSKFPVPTEGQPAPSAQPISCSMRVCAAQEPVGRHYEFELRFRRRCIQPMQNGHVALTRYHAGSHLGSHRSRCPCRHGHAHPLSQLAQRVVNCGGLRSVVGIQHTPHLALGNAEIAGESALRYPGFAEGSVEGCLQRNRHRWDDERPAPDAVRRLRQFLALSHRHGDQFPK